MNRFMFSSALAAICLGAVTASAADTVSYTDSVPEPSQTIRDNDYSGLVRTINVTNVPPAPTYEISVSLRIEPTDSGTVLGDYYAYLFHSDANGARSVVLLNRVGTSTMFPAGYTDESMDVTFRDDALNGDIHQYRITLGGPSQPALTGPLTGAWQPEGRTESPFTVSYDSPRTQWLSDFASMSPDGEWSLFIADVSFGGEGRLAEWTLHVTPVPVPEPSTIQFLAIIGGIGGLWLTFKRRR